jgi:ABC-2 type transport system permease protein
MKSDSLTGTGTLFRHLLRRDRLQVALWILIPLFFAYATAISAMGYQDIQTFVSELTENPLITSILGNIMASSIGGVVVWRATGQIVIIFGAIMMLSVIRYTRSEEESGRSELIRAYVTGPRSDLTAALLLTCSQSLLAGLLVALALLALAEPLAGSVLFGLTITMTGFIHAGVGAIVSQFTADASKTKAFAFAFLIAEVFFLIINNMQGQYSGWAWSTPMAWSRLTQPYYADNFLPLLLMLLAFVALISIAYALMSRRDFGAGILPEKGGRATASPSLRSPLALAWRLQRGSALGMLAAVLLIGGAVGGMAQSISETAGIGDLLGGIGGINWMETIGTRYSFLAIFIYILTLALVLYGMTSIARLQREEFAYRAELVLAKPVSRSRWMVSSLIVSLLCAAVFMAAMGLSSGLTFGLIDGDVFGSLKDILLMSLSKIPVLWCFMGISALIYGFWPRATTVISICVWVLFIAIELLWEGQFINWTVMQLSPLAYAHYTIPIQQLSVLPLIVLVLIAATLSTMGVTAFTKRSVGKV